MNQKLRTEYFGLLMLAAAVIVIVLVTPAFTSMWKQDLIVPGPGVTRQTKLSEYFPDLAGTPLDTDIYLLEGQEAGGTTLVMSGVHCNEPGAYLSSILITEYGKVSKGRLIVVPATNLSGFTCSDPGEGAPQRFTIETPNGPRTFKYGSRAINPIDSWPDPEVFVHYPSGQRLSGEETRNVNRAFPGKPDGTAAEKVCYGITQIIEKEGVDLVIDLHEAMPEYPNTRDRGAPEGIEPGGHGPDEDAYRGNPDFLKSLARQFSRAVPQGIGRQYKRPLCPYGSPAPCLRKAEIGDYFRSDTYAARIPSI